MAIGWGMELARNPHGRKNILSLVNLQLMLGNFGIPGGGLIPLRTHNNSQGACDMGGLPGYLPGYQSVESNAVRKKFEAAWGKGLPVEPGLTAMQKIGKLLDGLFSSVGRKRVKVSDLVTKYLQVRHG